MKKTTSQKIILVSNIGSASRKYFVYSVSKGSSKIQELFNIQFDEKEFYPNIKLEDAILEFFEIANRKYNLKIGDIDIIAERVVAVGEYFLDNRVISEQYVEELEKAKEYDILHTESLIKELQKLFLMREVCFRKNIKCKFKIVGISDSAFHKTISKEVYTYAVKDHEKNNYRKYGYHGISMSGLANDLHKKYSKIIALHLGGGGSVTAILNGKSIYNSFGMTPVSGLINLTRSGDLDPFVVLKTYQSNKKSFSLLDDSLHTFNKTKEDLYERSGLYSLAGEKDMRDILANLNSKNKSIKEKNNFAIDLYINKINESIGSAYASLGGCDCLSLTGAILEKSEIFRDRLLKKLSWINLKQKDILVLKTEEEKEIARLVLIGKFL
jgi:acetate kinase